MLSEIGSNFWLKPSFQYKNTSLGTPKQFNCLGNDYVWLSTGRSAIGYVIKTIELRKPNLKKVAVLPSFTCDTVFEPFLKAGYDVFYYPVEKDLSTSSEFILQTVMEHDASIVLFHRYFGFDTLDRQVNKLCETLRNLGKYSIEDCTQCLYSDIPRANSDFTIGSIRKWLGVPDGGFAVCREGVWVDKPNKTDVALEQAKVKASYAKYRYLFEQEGDKCEFLNMYREAEAILDNQNETYAISETSTKVQACLNRKKLISKRRSNFELLSKSLAGQVQVVFKLYDNKEVPLYFPILVDDRSSLQKHLRNHSIYAPVVWPKVEKQSTQCAGAENAYQHLLCIPIDQRYNADDMNRITKVISSFYNK